MWHVDKKRFAILALDIKKKRHADKHTFYDQIYTRPQPKRPISNKERFIKI